MSKKVLLCLLPLAVAWAILPDCDNGNPEFDPAAYVAATPFPSTDSILWAYRESIPVPLTRTAGIVDPEGKIRVICGNTMLNDTSYPFQEVFDPAANTWTVDSSLRHPGGGVHNHDCEILGDTIYVGWGSYKTGYYNNLTRIILSSDTWQVVGPAPVSNLLYYEFAACNGTLYLFGGAPDGGTSTNAARVFDPQTGQWTSLTNIPIAVRDPAACTVGDTIYLFGGFSSGTTPTPNCYAYNTVANSWRSLAGMARRRGWATAHAVTHPDSGVFIYVCGGESAGTVRNFVDRYSVATNTWVTEQPMLRPRRSQAGAVIEPCSLYALTGYWGSRPFIGSVECGVVSLPTGIAEKPGSVPHQAITVWPNPCRDFCQIRGLARTSELVVSDVTGRVILRPRPGIDSQTTVDLQDCAPGVYLVRSGHEVTARVVKQ